MRLGYQIVGLISGTFSSGGTGINDEVNWSLQDLEQIVYDFINYSGKRNPNELIDTKNRPQKDVTKEDMINFHKKNLKLDDEN